MKLLYQSVIKHSRFYLKLLILMKLTVLILITLFLQEGFSAHAQRISIKKNDASLHSILKEIRKQSGYDFFIEDQSLDQSNKVDIAITNGTVEEVLDESFKNQPFTYSVENNAIIVRKTVPSPQTSPLTIKQQTLVEGKVTDSEGTPLPGVSVRVEDTERGTSTNNDGLFSIRVNTGEQLIFTYVGFSSQQLQYEGQNSISVVLEPAVTAMEEIVVVGYGTQKKINMTGAVSTVDFDERTTNRALTNVSSALSGLLPGLAVNQNSGMAGQNSGIMKIRGLGTVNNSNPLIVVDGMPDADINLLNMNDIESVSVLKDAASAAVYGSRAANGVILITTKSGKGLDKTRINFSSSYAVERPTNVMDFNENYAEALIVHQRAAAQGGSAQIFRDGSIDQWAAMSMIDQLRYPNTDWWDLIVRNGEIQNYNLSASGGTEKSNFFTSVGIVDQKGLQIGNDYKRYNGRLNYEFKVLDNLIGGTRVDGNWTKYNSAGGEGFTNDNSNGGYSIYAAVAGMTPYDPVTGYYGETMAYGESSQAYNPIAQYENNLYKSDRQTLNSSLYLDWEPISGLHGRVDYSLNYYNQFSKSYQMPYTRYNFQTEQISRNVGENAGISNTTNTGYKTLLNGRLNYDKTFGLHTLGALFVYSEEFWYARSQSGSRTDRLHPSLTEIDAASLENQRAGGNSSTEGLRSYIGRLNYSFNDKYLFEGNFRYDGSSKFREGSRFGFFPSVAVGWNFTREEFWNALADRFLSSGKIRASYGSLGNNSGVSRYEQQETLSQAHYFIDNNIVKGLVNRKMVNEALTWEETKVFNLGLDLGFLENSLTVELDYYDRLTTGMNRPSDLSLLLSGAYSAPRRNIGNMRNRGIEGNFTYQNNVNDFSYRVSLNASYNQNRLEEWNEFLAKGSVYLNMPYNFLYMYMDEGIAQTWQDIYDAPYQGQYIAPGDVLRQDLNGDGQITSEDRKAFPRTQNGSPTTHFGLNGSVSWKGIDLSFLLQGSAGRTDTWKTRYNTSTILANIFASSDLHYNNTWSTDNRDATHPRLITGSGGGTDVATTSFWMDDMSYLRFKNIQLSYNIPQQWMSRIGISTARVYASAENLITITGYRGLDPERAGYTNSLYPITKSFSFGINIGI